MIDIWYNDRREGERMARERFSFDDTIEFDKDELITHTNFKWQEL